jgi:hypothetical protein
MTKTNQEPSRRKKRLIWVILPLILIIAAGFYLYAGWLEYQESPMSIEVLEGPMQTERTYSFSQDQEDQLVIYGFPEGFTILFYEEETLDGGVQSVRLETWDYYTQGIGLTFENGDLTAEDKIEIESIGNLEPLPYSPDQFSAFMSLNEVIAAAGIDNYVEIPLDKEFLEGGVSYFAKALTFGLKDNELLYLEALAIHSQ